MTINRTSNSRLVLGTVLIILGLLAFIGTLGIWNFDRLFNWIDWNIVWPAAMILLGLAILSGTFLTPGGRPHPGSATFGTIVTLLGIFFLATTLGYLSWSDQGVLWPIYPLVVGIGLLVGYFTAQREQPGYLVGGLVTGTIGLAFLAVSVTNSYQYMSMIWPLALILGGVLLLAVRPRPNTLNR
jgi:hypothetical protein